MKKILLPIILVLAIVIASGCTQTGAGTGNLVLQITDKPALDIEKAEVTISKIQVHLATSGNDSNATTESGWLTVVEGPVTYDLVAINDVNELLGEKQLAAGIYTQIRLDVDKALVTINGTEHNLTIPSKTVKLVKEFEIKDGVTTTLTLDFDAENSVHEASDGKYIMRPTIKVLSENEEPEDDELSTEEQACIDAGGTVETSSCCTSVEDFPDTCLIGACGCAAEESHDVKTCNCGEGMCFDGENCMGMA